MVVNFGVADEGLVAEGVVLVLVDWATLVGRADFREGDADEAALVVEAVVGLPAKLVDFGNATAEVVVVGLDGGGVGFASEDGEFGFDESALGVVDAKTILGLLAPYVRIKCFRTSAQIAPGVLVVLLQLLSTPRAILYRNLSRKQQLTRNRRIVKRINKFLYPRNQPLLFYINRPKG